MKRTIALLTLLGLVGSASAATVGHWRFEEGTPGVANGGDHDNFYVDGSGNGNHMSAVEASGNPTASADLPFTSQGGTTNEVALDFDGGNDHVGTWGIGDIHDKALDSYSFTSGWTIEATFKARSYSWGGIIGKDGQPDAGRGEANVAFKMRDDSHRVECGFYDDTTNWVWLVTETLDLDRWYSLAATYDDVSNTYSLYLKQQDGGGYVLQGSTTGVFGGAALNLETDFWVVGEGMWAGNRTDAFNGIIDEVRVSDVMLGTNNFINQDGFTIPFDIEQPEDVVAGNFSGWDERINLYSSEYWSPSGLAFSASQWQVSTDSNFVSTAWDSGTAAAQAYVALPGNALAPGTYYGRARYQGDSTWSDWSGAFLLDLTDHTIAYWRFENGANGVEHPADLDDFYLDSTANGNHLSSFAVESRPVATNEIPFATIPGVGSNTLAVDFDFGTSGTEGVDDLGTFGNGGGKMIESYNFVNGWTMECTFKARDIDHFQVVMGKDGKKGDGAEQPFSFKLFDTNVEPTIGLRCLILRDDDNFDFIDTPPLVAGKWYTAVATYDNVDFNLYLKSEDDADFILQGSLNRTQGIQLGVLNSGTWTVGRGMWDNNPTDFFNGQIDEVRVSDIALNPQEFLRAAELLPPIGDIDMADMPGGFDLTWTTSQDYDYMLLEKTNLQTPVWSTNTTVVGGDGSVTVPVPDSANQIFYKVISE